MTGPPESAALRLIRPGYRRSFLVRLYLISAAGSTLLFAVLYFALSQPLPDSYGAAFHMLRGTSGYLGAVLPVFVLAYAFLVFVSLGALCICWLHKVAGPLYRLERIIEGYRSGGVTRTISFRCDDQIEPLAEAFNDWIGSLRQDRQRWLVAMEDAERPGLQEEAASRRQMEAALRKIAEELSRYR